MEEADMAAVDRRAATTTIWSWDEQTQRDLHARAFNPGRWQIITKDGADIGMLDVEYRPDEIYLARIEIHPDHQGGGIGTCRLPLGLSA